MRNANVVIVGGAYIFYNMIAAKKNSAWIVIKSLLYSKYKDKFNKNMCKILNLTKQIPYYID